MQNRHIQYAGLFCFLLFLIFIPFVLDSAGKTQGNTKKQVLILHSYHKGLDWTDGQEEAIREKLADYPDMEIYTEYLDSKREPLGKVADLCATALTRKYAKNPPDIIICSDNNALTFLRKYRKKLFSGTPVVFCGINNYQPSMLEGFEDKVTGIIQELDPLGTVHLIKKLQPELQRLVVISGTTPTAQAIRKETEKALSLFKGKNSIEILWYNKLTTKELILRIKELSANDAVLLCNFNRDAMGKYYTHKKSAQMISKFSPAPVYAMEDHYIGTGIVGGYMNTAETQGGGAAELAITILKNKEIPPAIETCPNIAMFDSNAMSAHNLDDSLLPADAVIVNKHFSFFKTYQALILHISGFILLLIISLCVMSVNIARRRQNEMNLHVTLNSIGDAVISTDINGCVTRMNKVAEQLTGWQLSDAEGKPLSEVFNIVNADTRQPVQNPTEKVLKTGRIVGLANHTLLISKDGSEYLINDSAAPIKYTDGKLIGVVLVFRDVNEEERLQAELQESAEQYKIIYDTSGDGIMTITPPEWKFTTGNAKIIEIFGVKTKKEFFALEPWQLSPKYQPDGQLSAVKAKLMIELAMKKGENFFEWKHKKVNGEEFFATVLLNKVEYRGETFLQARVSDITEKKLIEQKLKNSETRYRTLLNNSLAGVLVAEIKTQQIRFANPAICKMLGYSREELLEKHIEALHPPDKLEYVISEFQAQSEGKNPLALDIPFLKKNGDIVFTDISTSSAIIDGVHCNIGVIIDITQRKEVENELVKMQKLKSIGTLAGGIAHDFNNILLGIFGNIALAKMEMEEDHSAYSLILEAEKAMNRATSLTNQLLTFAKGGAPVTETIRIADIVKDIATFTLSGSNVKPVIKSIKKLWTAEADKGQMEQVVSNLIINADQAMPEGGNLYITLTNEEIEESIIPNLDKGKYIKITVKDKGIGIAPQHLENVFDPYFSTKHAGNGLGLATAYSIVDRHNGFMGVTSELGKGATFTLYLPASSSLQPQKNATAIEEIPPADKKGRILIMDDEAYIRKLTEKMLIRNDFFVETAENGIQAIEKYTEAMKDGIPFDIVLMDLTIPGGMGGKEAVKALLKVDPNAKTIVFSGYSTDPIMADYADYGFKGKLLKPFRMEELKKEVFRIM